MRIIRHCRERLPGGTRRWRRLARAADFHGALRVYGYGTVGRPAIQHRRAARTGELGGFVLGDYTNNRNLIRVWVRSPCAPVTPTITAPHDDPLSVFAHELGHHRQHAAGKRYGRSKRARAAYEAVAERYGRWLLRAIR